MSLNIIQHKKILIKILKDIFTDTTLGPILGFKGGSAAYLFYGLDRFSVDLDFDLLDESKKDYVFERVHVLLEKYGKLKQAEKKNSTLFFLLSYDNKELDAQNIKVEINLRSFGSKYIVESYLGISMKVMTQEDMFAHKLVAMLERIGKTNRDFFDVAFFLQKEWPINKKIVELRTGLSYPEFLKKCIEALEKLGGKDMLSGMGELLSEPQKNWVKTQLRTETIFLLKLELDNE
jgi:predicted nucleotidyltransferase component of viral defense system